MKRFVVVVTSLLIIFVFIALNYLLLDRESLVSIRESNQASIDALSRINLDLSEEKSKLSRQVEEMREQIENLNERINELENSNAEQQQIIDKQNKLILELKALINPEPVKNETLDLINYISEKNLDKAYLKFSSLCSFWGNNWTRRIFTNYFAHNVKDIKPVIDPENNEPAVEVVPYQTSDFNIKVTARVQVDLADKSISEYLKEGENVVEMDFTYDDMLEQWVITSITSEPVENSDSQEQIADNESSYEAKQEE